MRTIDAIEHELDRCPTRRVVWRTTIGDKRRATQIARALVLVFLSVACASSSPSAIDPSVGRLPAEPADEQELEPVEEGLSASDLDAAEPDANNEAKPGLARPAASLEELVPDYHPLYRIDEEGRCHLRAQSCIRPVGGFECPTPEASPSFANVLDAR